MPKDKSDSSRHIAGHRVSPYPCNATGAPWTSTRVRSENDRHLKEWEDARCPVCMEHPHNAVLLICSSHEKGCRPYMCDTSYRHSNCLDQYRKSFEAAKTTNGEVGVFPPLARSRLESTAMHVHEERDGTSTPSLSSTCGHKLEQKLLCPLCRGHIKEWVVMDSARHFMNGKARTCSCETCDFIGTYSDLRKHARQEHPSVRPSEIDPERERNWRRLERQRDIGDLLSTLESSAGEELIDEALLSMGDHNLLTVFFFIRVIQPRPGSRSSWSGSSGSRRRSRRLWGEAHNGEANMEGQDNSSDESTWSHGDHIR